MQVTALVIMLIVTIRAEEVCGTYSPGQDYLVPRTLKYIFSSGTCAGSLGTWTGLPASIIPCTGTTAQAALKRMGIGRSSLI